MIYLNIGRRRQGKTTLTTFMARKVERRLMFDPRGLMQFGTTVHTRQQFIDAFTELVDGDRVEVVFTPNADLQKSFKLFAYYARAWVTRYGARSLAIVIDEVAFVDTDVEDFLWVLRCSDPSVHHVFVTAHRPADVSTRVRAIADHWLLFGVRQEHDLRVITERCGRPVAVRVSKLGPREFVHWDDAIGSANVFRDPAAWFVPLGGNRAPAAAHTTVLADLSPAVDAGKLFS